MTRRGLDGKWIVLLLGASSAEAAPFGDALAGRLTLSPIVLDYELPGHPREVGRGYAGLISTASLVWVYDRYLTVVAGFLLRVPFAHNFSEETDAFPLVAVTVTPFGPLLSLTLGSLDIHHGHHRGVVDEVRYAYGRPYEELYNRTISVEREVGEDPFLPVENGFSIRGAIDYLSAEIYLDWQLLESIEHREKFAVGLLGKLESKWIDVRFDYRLVHYGGQLFTKRRAGLDPKRQPQSLAAEIVGRPLQLEYLRIELAAAFLYGRAVQAPDQRESSHFGFEGGGDVVVFDIARVGYRVWLPKENLARSLSEDGDPVYAGPRSHRATIGLSGEYGIARLSGRLDLVFQHGADKVQYLTATTLDILWEPLIFGDLRYP